MPPNGPRANARKRAADAYKLRCQGRTWDAIAQLTGYKSHAAAFNAVKKHIERMPPEDQAIARAYSAGNYRHVIAQLYEVAERARALNRTTSELQALQAIADVQDKHDKLTGLHVSVPTEVNVNVNQTLTEILTTTRSRLLDVVDAEVVELPGIEASRESA